MQLLITLFNFTFKFCSFLKKSFLKSLFPILFKVIVEDIAQQLISILQQDPRYVPKPPGTMEVEAPSQKDPFELLEKALKITSDHMESKKVIFVFA